MNKPIDLRAKFKSFLYEHQFLPLSVQNKTWVRVPIVHHSRKPSNKKIADDKRLLKETVPQGPGVYLYLSKSGQLLYFGKANNILHRVRSHYREAFEIVPGDRKGIWHAFFSKNAGQLDLMWRQVRHDRQRIAIEEMVEDVIRSKFDRIFPRRKRTDLAIRS